jgi:ribosomal protein S15P/S13E
MSEETQEVENVETTEATTETVKTPQEEVVQERPKATTTVEDDGVIKVDLRQPSKTEERNAVQEQKTTSVDVDQEAKTSQGVDGEVRTDNTESEAEEQVLELVEEDQVEEQEQTLAEKIKDIPKKLKEQPEDVNNSQETSDLPENVNKLLDFMRDTGGTLEDYVNLNKDYDSMEDIEILREHYRQTKPHLSEEEISFLMEDSFSYDEEVDEERDIKRKKLALKESIAEAKSNLTTLKDKYYAELKLSSKLSPEQVEAVEFYNKYKNEQESAQQLNQQQRSVFEERTNKLFSDEFKGFEYKVGNNKYRFKVKDVNTVKNNQSDINNLVSKFTNQNNEIQDAAGYHKALFTAMNADAIANHFYEQGKADAIKTQLSKSKNIDMNPRGAHQEVTTNSGFKIRAVSGDDSSRLRIKMKQ